VLLLLLPVQQERKGRDLVEEKIVLLMTSFLDWLIGCFDRRRRRRLTMVVPMTDSSTEASFYQTIAG
jgi:hypothetical protein